MESRVKTGRTRRPRGSLTRDEVIEAALALADREGLEALTMPNLARRLDCGVMTIYGYVEDKEDLLDGIAQRGIRDLRLTPPVPDDLEGILHAWGTALRATLVAHPCLPVIFLSRAVVGSGIFRGVEALLGRLTRAGLDTSAGVQAIYAVLIYTTGFVAWEIPRTRRQPQSAYATAWRKQFAALAPSDFPNAGSALEALTQVAGDQQFEAGLIAMCAGFALGLKPGVA